MLDCLEPGAELRIDRRPRNGGRLAKLMATPCKPHINVETHGTVAQLADRRLQQRHWMVPECLPEHFVEDHAILPKRALAVLRHLEAKPRGNNRAAGPGFVFVVFPKKL